MSFPKVTFQIVTYNSKKYLADCLESIFNQTYRDFQILVIDNNSQDGTAEFLKKNYPNVAVFANKKNVGFAKANNQGLRLLNSPYVVFINADIVLTPEWLAVTMAAAESEKYRPFASFGGKLLKLKIIDQETNETEKSDIIDSCGLKVLKSHWVIERGAWEESGKFFEEQEVFGQSAALALFRREALEDCALKLKFRPEAEYFDEDFFFYKEDVDLAWRLQLFGHKSLFLPAAKAYHIRSLAGSRNQNIWQVIRDKKKYSKLAKRYSYRNQFLVLAKNEFVGNLFKYAPYIIFYELEKLAYALILEWSSLPAIWQAIALYPRMLAKRKLIFQKIRVNAEYIRKWIE